VKYDPRGCLYLAGGLALALLIPVAVGAGGLTFARILAVSTISILAILLGRPLGIVLRLPRKPGFISAFEIVAGFAGLSLLHLAFTVGLKLTWAPAFGLSAAVTTVFFLIRGRLPPAPSPGQAPERWPYADFVLLLALALASTLWSIETVTALRAAQATGIFPAWPDFFLHASQIHYLEAYPWFHGGSTYVGGTRHGLYHEGSYALAAVYAGWTGESALQSATIFWLPAGLVLMGMGAYGFASALGGRLAGAAAALALFLIPDASHYGVANSFFSFHWALEVFPASGYGIALAFLAFAIFALGLPAARTDWLLAGGGLAVLSGCFKMQTAAPAVLLLAVFFFATWNPAQRWRYWAAVSVAVFLVGVGVMLSEHIGTAPHFLSGRYEPMKFFAFAHANSAPAFARLYEEGTAGWAPWLRGMVGTGLLLAAAFGAVLPAWLVLTLFFRRPQRPWQVRWLPIALVGAYLATMFLVPTTAPGDYTEFAHRPFVLIYAVLLASLAAESFVRLRAAAASRPWLGWGLFGLGLPLAVACLIGDHKAAAHLQQQQRGEVDFPSEVPLSRDELAATQYIRDHALPSDWVLSSDGDPSAYIAGLTERTAFISRFTRFNLDPGPVGDLVRARNHLGGPLRRVRSFAQLKQFGQDHHIRWYLLLQPAHMPHWPPALLDHCQFQSGAVRVFDLGAPGSEGGGT